LKAPLYVCDVEKEHHYGKEMKKHSLALDMESTFTLKKKLNKDIMYAYGAEKPSEPHKRTLLPCMFDVSTPFADVSIPFAEAQDAY